MTPRLILWIFYAYITSSPFFGFSLFNMGGRGLARVDWLVAGILLCVFSLGLITRRLRLRYSPVNGFTVMFFFSGLLGVIHLFNASNAQLFDFSTKAAQLLLAIVFFFAVSNLPISEQDLMSCLRLWIFAAFILAFFVIYQIFARIFGWPFANIELTNPSVTYMAGEERTIPNYFQASGIFSEPSYLGAYLIGPIIFSSVFFLTGRSDLLLSKSTIVNGVLLAVLIFALLLTGSQAAYLTLTATIGCMFITGWVGRMRTIKLLAIIFGLFILVGFLLTFFEFDFLDAITLRFKYLILNMMDPLETAEVTSYRVRSKCFQAALNVWILNPLLGVGLNGMSYHTDVCEFTLGWFQLLVDQGILGIVALILVFWSLIYGMRRLSKENYLSPFWRIIIIGLIFVLVSDIIDGIFTYNWVDLQRWFTLGLANMVYIQANSKLLEIRKKTIPKSNLSLVS